MEEDSNQEALETLKRFVAIKSISMDPSYREDGKKAAAFLTEFLKGLGADVNEFSAGTDEIGGETVERHPILLARLGNDPEKKTVGFYAHYDVQPAEKSDGWKTDPFVLTEEKGNLFGRGAADDKGPLTAFLMAVKQLHDTNSLPVNLQIVIEGGEEVGSTGFKEFLEDKKTELEKASVFIVSDGYWIDKENPNIEYGLKGNVYFGIEIKGPNMDLHSGDHGGAVNEPMVDLVSVLHSLYDQKTQKVLVPGFYEDVLVSEKNKAQIAEVYFSVEQYKHELGVSKLQADTKDKVLLKRWWLPTLTIHGIEGGFSGPGAKTVIPGTVTGKVSMRTVPNQDPKKIEQAVTEYVTQQFNALESGNRIKVHLMKHSNWWYNDPDNPFTTAAITAIEKSFKKKPFLVGVGGSINAVGDIDTVLKTPLLLVPIGQSDDGAHSNQEKIGKHNFLTGITLFKELLKELA